MKTERLPKVGHLHRALQESKGRTCQKDVLLSQIGKAVIMRVSGGRHQRIVVYRDPVVLHSGLIYKDAEGETVGVFLPMTKYDGIRVLYNAMDLYDVQRVKLHRDGSITILHQYRDVFADNLSEVVLMAEGFSR